MTTSTQCIGRLWCHFVWYRFLILFPDMLFHMVLFLSSNPSLKSINQTSKGPVETSVWVCYKNEKTNEQKDKKGRKKKWKERKGKQKEKVKKKKKYKKERGLGVWCGLPASNSILCCPSPQASPPSLSLSLQCYPHQDERKGKESETGKENKKRHLPLNSWIAFTSLLLVGWLVGWIEWY